MFFMKSLKTPTNAFNVTDYVKFNANTSSSNKLQHARSTTSPAVTSILAESLEYGMLYQ